MFPLTFPSSSSNLFAFHLFFRHRSWVFRGGDKKAAGTSDAVRATVVVDASLGIWQIDRRS